MSPLVRSADIASDAPRFSVITRPGSALHGGLRSLGDQTGRLTFFGPETESDREVGAAGCLVDAACLSPSDADRVATLLCRGAVLVVVAAANDDAERLDWLARGAADCVPPSWPPSVMLDRLAMLVRQYAGAARPEPAAPAEALKFGGWTFDQSRDLLTSPSGHARRLGRSSALILARLLEEPRKPHGLLDLRFHGDHTLSANHVRVTVSRLRALFAAEDGGPVISANGRYGYQLVADVEREPAGRVPVGQARLSLGRLLSRARAERGLSQLDLALEAGISARHLSFVETGRSRPSRRIVQQLCDALLASGPERVALLAAAGRLD